MGGCMNYDLECCDLLCDMMDNQYLQQVESCVCLQVELIYNDMQFMFDGLKDMVMLLFGLLG